MGRMRDILRDMTRFGGIARRSQLVALGASASSIQSLIRERRLSVPRRGWVNSSDAPAQAMRAIELGGIVGGRSALQIHGIWADGEGLVVATPQTASRLPPLAYGETRLWVRSRFPDGTDRLWRASVLDALLQHASMVDRQSLIASVDSALHHRRLSNAGLGQLIAALPEHLRGIRPQLDSRSMSGTESKLRLACIAAGLKVEPQAAINRVGFVDLLIDDWLIVEVDSRQFHDEAVHQHRDRIRDGNAILGSFGNLRFDYQLVQFEPDWCVEVILARLKSGRP
jgi:very-short-patch-repair endonuclease